jgi:hypothetical protein
MMALYGRSDGRLEEQQRSKAGIDREAARLLSTNPVVQFRFRLLTLSSDVIWVKVRLASL